MSHSHHKSGFTLLEVSIAMMLSTIVIGGIAGLQYIITKNQFTVLDSSFKVEVANTTVANIVRELRTMRSGDNGAYAIESGGDQSIVFYSDVDYDGAAEKVRYFLENTTLKKGVIQPTGYPVTYPSNTEKITFVADDVRNNTLDIFTYYNGDWPTDSLNNPLSTPVDTDEVRMMRVYIRVNDQENEPDDDFVLESYVNIRTLKDNL